MKKLIIVSVLLLSTVFSANTLFAKPKIRIGVSLDIGRASKDCAGFSVCSITIGPALDIAGVVYVDDQTGAFTITMSGSDISSNEPNKLQYFNNDGTVTFDEDWTAPASLDQAMEATSAVVVPAGTYSWSMDTQGNISITVPQ